MTPNKSKKPLPSSNSMAFPEQPETLQQWRAALHKVKILYLRGQWKQCTALCSQLLDEASGQPHPLHATFLHFYSAVSYEAVARMTHSLSIAKLHALEQAKASYQAAASSLSDPDIILEIHASYDTDSLSTCSSMSLPESECWGSHIAIADTFVRHDSADGCASSPSSIEPDGVIHSSNKLRPSPLCITKVSRFDTQPNKRKDDRVIPKASSMPHCNTPSKRRPSTPPTASRPIFVIFSNSVDSLFQLRNYDLYNDHLTSFAKMLASHISAVDLNIQKTQEAQAARYFTKRQAIYGEDQEAKAADLRARISRLRANRGQMERFAPERYQELCAQALAEL